MPDSDVSSDRLAFSSRIEVILLIKECHLDVVEIIEYMLNNVLLVQLCKSSNSDKILASFADTVEPRPVISSIAQLVKLSK